MLIAIVTLFRWKCTLINSLSQVNELSKQLIQETSELQVRHSALALDHEKNVDRYINLKDQYAVLVTAVSLFQQKAHNDQSINSRKPDRRKN